MKWKRVKKHFPELDKITRQLIFYDIISIPLTIQTNNFIYFQGHIVGPDFINPKKSLKMLHLYANI